MRDVVAAMTAYTLELRAAEIKLNQNESPFDVPAELKRDVLARLAERPWNRYPDFESTALREALARANGLAPENILVGNGSNELLAAAIGAFVGPGTPVILPRPTFTLYEKLVTVAGGVVIAIDFDPDSGLLPLERMLDAIVPDAVVIVCSPNNPTGGVLPEGGLDALLDSGATVLLDRAYGDFDTETSPHPGSSLRFRTSLSRERKRAHPRGRKSASSFSSLHDRLVTFSTFSKAWGLAALRVGWLAATARTCREIRKVKLPYSLNILSEAIAAVALENRAIRDANVARIVGERDRVARALGDIAFPSRANFIAFRPRRNSKDVFEDLYARGILVRDVSAYPRMQNCLRVSIGTRAQNDAFLEALAGTDVPSTKGVI